MKTSGRKCSAMGAICTCLRLSTFELSCGLCRLAPRGPGGHKTPLRCHAEHQDYHTTPVETAPRACDSPTNPQEVWSQMTPPPPFPGHMCEGPKRTFPLHCNWRRKLSSAPLVPWTIEASDRLWGAQSLFTLHQFVGPWDML